MSKYENLEKSTVLLYPGQKLELDAICKEIHEWRKHVVFKDKKERITANMLIRCLVRNFIDLFPYCDGGHLENEEMVNKWSDQFFKKTTIAKCLKNNPEAFKKSLKKALHGK
jgi:hypothetical protein